MIEKSIKGHFVFWVVFVLIGIASLSPYYQSLFKATMHRLVFLPVWWFVTYINLLLFLPKFFDRKKYLPYFLWLTIVVLAMTIFQRWVCIDFIYPRYFWMRDPNQNELNVFWAGPFIQFMFYIFIPVLLTTALRQGFKWYRESYKIKQVLAEQQAAELNYLKAQINPHFLFNTLNNLYGLSLESSEKVPCMILRLSDILNYSLYESKQLQVELGKEVQLIRDFISLESGRYEERISVNFDSSIEDGVMVSPLLMMPLVENAFKHGVKESIAKLNIDIDLNWSDGILVLKVINDIPASSISQDHSGGIGLTNLKRRLELIYENKHELDTHISNGKYYATLKIVTDE